MGLAVGPRAHVPVSHNRRVTNVLLIAPLRTETDRRGGRRAEGERVPGCDEGWLGHVAGRRGWVGGREDSCGGVWDGMLYQADRLEITREEGDAASGSGEYAFWITGGCPREGCRVVCRARLVSLCSQTRRNFGERDETPRHLIHHLCTIWFYDITMSLSRRNLHTRQIFRRIFNGHVFAMEDFCLAKIKRSLSQISSLTEFARYGDPLSLAFW